MKGNDDETMEEALSEERIMDYESDEEENDALDDLINLATNITDSSPTVRDAAERLLTLLGMEESEDEGVVIDIDVNERNNFHIDNHKKERTFISKTCFDDSLRISEYDDDDDDSWTDGWEACTNEAIRFLIEDEGLSPQHPTVVALKNHLTSQKEQFFTRRAI